MAMEKRPPENLTVPMLQWEETMSPLAGKYDDCRLVLLHLRQMLEEHPWLAVKHGVTVEYMEGIRDGVEETLRRAFAFWNGNFMEPLQEMGFENPDP
jgi:hypothetical protein